MEYEVKIKDKQGLTLKSTIDLEKCFQDVGINPNEVVAIGSYLGNIQEKQQKNNRIIVTGSAGFTFLGEQGQPLCEIKNQLIYDNNPPPNMNSSKQVSVQVVTKNNLTGKKHKYNPPEQHFIKDGVEKLEMTNLEGDEFVDISYVLF